MSPLRPAHPRCFVALAPDPPPGPLVAHHCRLAGDVPVGVDWLHPSALHVTLCFLGWLTSQECAAVREAMDAVGPPPDEVSLTGEARVVGEEHTRSLVALVEPAPRLLDHRAALAAALRARLGPRPADTPYLPHLTLARIAPGPLPRDTEWAVDRLRLPVAAPGLYAGVTAWTVPGTEVDAVDDVAEVDAVADGVAVPAVNAVGAAPDGRGSAEDTGGTGPA